MKLLINNIKLSTCPKNVFVWDCQSINSFYFIYWWRWPLAADVLRTPCKNRCRCSLTSLVFAQTRMSWCLSLLSSQPEPECRLYELCPLVSMSGDMSGDNTFLYSFRNSLHVNDWTSSSHFSTRVQGQSDVSQTVEEEWHAPDVLHRLPSANLPGNEDTNLSSSHFLVINLSNTEAELFHFKTFPCTQRLSEK